MPPAGTQAAQLYVGIGAIGARETIMEIMRISGLVDKVDGEKADVTIAADGRAASTVIDEIRNKARALDASDPQITTTVAAGGSNQLLDELRAKSAALDASDPHITPQVDTVQANRQIDGLMARLRGMGGGGGLGKAQGAMMIGQGVMGGGGFGGAMNMGMGVASMGGGGMAAMAGGGIAAAGLLAVGSIMKAGEMEKYETQLSVLLGSVEKAKQRVAELAKFGAETPFELPEVVQASKTLQVFAGDVLSTGEGLRMIGDVAAGTQQNFGEVSMWFGRMYDAMKSGRPFGEATMRLQEMGALSGSSREKIEKLAVAVKDGSMTMEDAWKGAAGEFGRYNGMMGKQSKTLEGKMSNFSDAVGMGLAKIGEKLLPMAKGFLDIAIPAVSLFADALANMVGFIQSALEPIGWLVDRGRDFVGWLDSVGVLKAFGDGLKVLGDAAQWVSDIFTSEGQKMSRAMLEAGKTPDAVAADLRESRSQMSVAGAYGLGDPLKNAVKDGMKGAQGAVDAGLTDIVTTIRNKRAELMRAASGAGEALYRPIEARAELSLLELEIKRQANLKNSKTATKEEVLAATQALAAAQKRKIELLAELESYGKLSRDEQVGFLNDLKKKYKNATGESRIEIGRLIAQLEELIRKGRIAANALGGFRHGLSGQGGWGGNAIGGWREAGEPGWVGEHGKELFIPKVPGFIANDRDMTAAAMGAGAGQPMAMGGTTIVLQPIFEFQSLVPYTPAQQEELARFVGPAIVPYLEGRGFTR